MRPDPVRVAADVGIDLVRARAIITKHNDSMSEAPDIRLTHLTRSADSRSMRNRSWVIGLLILTLVLLALGGESVRAALRYERQAVLAGEYWRLLTGHLVHGGFAHLLLNVAGLGVVAVLFPRDYSAGQWLWIALASIAAIDVGFVFYEPQLLWYVGFSGVLHGAFAAGAVGWWRHESWGLALVLTLILVAKLSWDPWHGTVPFSGDMEIVASAHIYGAIGGLGAALSLLSIRWLWSRPAASL
jgi:rhomboid family GlyGly-CTERM serine protease